MERELNILLIEDDADTCKRIAEYVEDTKDVAISAVTNNSYRALELLREYVPDAVILDLELNHGKGSGLHFLQELAQKPPVFKPYVLVTTNNSSALTYDYARQLGADFIMSKHQEDYNEKSAVDFLKMMKDIIQNNLKKHNPDYNTDESDRQKEKRLARIINRELDLVGVSPKMVGYTYLTDAVLLILEGETGNLCNVVGEKHGKTNSSVERAMQNAINSAWRSNDIDALLEHYTARINPDRGVPTLTEFVHFYANKIKNG